MHVVYFYGDVGDVKESVRCSVKRRKRRTCRTCATCQVVVHVVEALFARLEDELAGGLQSLGLAARAAVAAGHAPRPAAAAALGTHPLPLDVAARMCKQSQRIILPQRYIRFIAMRKTAFCETTDCRSLPPPNPLRRRRPRRGGCGDTRRKMRRGSRRARSRCADRNPRR
jgi:hypothetical protein